MPPKRKAQASSPQKSKKSLPVSQTRQSLPKGKKVSRTTRPAHDDNAVSNPVASSSAAQVDIGSIVANLTKSIADSVTAAVTAGVQAALQGQQRNEQQPDLDRAARPTSDVEEIIDVAAAGVISGSPMSHMIVSDDRPGSNPFISTTIPLYADVASKLKNKFEVKMEGIHATDEPGSEWVLGLCELNTKAATDVMKILHDILQDVDNRAKCIYHISKINEKCSHLTSQWHTSGSEITNEWHVNYQGEFGSVWSFITCSKHHTVWLETNN